jgi:hypothetical protein
MLKSQHKELKKALENLLIDIAKETELIQNDNLARGKLVHSSMVNASFRKEENNSFWQWFNQAMRTPVREDDPPEYWGDFNPYGWGDFVAGTNEYPWMPESISEEEFPF